MKRLPLGAGGRRLARVRFVMEDTDDGRAAGFGFADQFPTAALFLASSEAVGSSSSRMGSRR